ncbi:hypothetical protein K0651_07330 [Ornithinimicrobium sp. Arc0846-15]|nr:hypothetical protein [Ornithinimicrobium laminariae]
MTRSRALIIVLVVAMAAIITAAWWVSRGVVSADPLPTSDAGTATAISDASSVEATEEVFGPLVLDVSSDGALIRAQLGSCTGATEPTVWTTSGADEAFAPTQTVPLSKIQSADIDGDDLTLIGADGDCAATKATSDDGGQSWTTEADDSIPADPETCDITSVHAGAEVSLALCPQNDSIYLITDGEVVSLSSLADITGIAQTEDETYYAVASTEACSSQVLEYGSAATGDGDSAEPEWSQLSCIGFRTAATGLAIDGDDTLYVQAGNDLLVSDDGVDWTNPLEG